MAYSVIIVDDEKWVRELVRLSLDWDRLGCEILGLFENGGEAITFAKQSPPDIAILDIEMPGVSGLGFLDAMVTDFPYTAVVVLSGYSDFEYARHALRRGAVDYLLKPLDEERLAAVVRGAIEEIEERRRSERRNRESRARYNRLRRTRMEASLSGEGEAARVEGGAGAESRDPRVLEITRKIEASLTTPPTLEEAAEAVGLTASYFSQLFSNSVGTSYVEYVRERRIGRAEVLLRTTWMRIGEIGELVGYPNANYFARVFREATGMLPSEYRKSEGSDR